MLGVILGLAAIGLTLALSRAKPAAAEPRAYIPTVNEILSSQSTTVLSVYYDLIGELYITGQITLEEYTSLYDAYYTRWYELTGAI